MASTLSPELQSNADTERFQFLLESIEAAVCILGPKGQMIQSNDRWQDFQRQFPVVDSLCVEGCHFPDVCREATAETKIPEWDRIADSIEHLALCEDDRLEVSLRSRNGNVFGVFIARDNAQPHSHIVLTAIDKSKTHSLSEQLDEATRQAGAAEMATGVLHNVGNVLNSVNISARIIQRKVEDSGIASLNKLNDIVAENQQQFAHFVEHDKRGQLLPQYIQKLAANLSNERDELIKEIANLSKNIEHIKEIVNVQQSYAKLSGCTQEIDMAQVIDDALTAVNGSIINHKIELIKNIEPVPTIESDKHKLLQILVNLLTNAKDAMSGHDIQEPRIDINVCHDESSVIVEVKDNGIGITSENIANIFQHGFTTKKTGHGFGLHSCSISAKQLGGSLVFESDGPGCGAVFRLSLPIHSQT